VAGPVRGRSVEQEGAGSAGVLLLRGPVADEVLGPGQLAAGRRSPARMNAMAASTSTLARLVSSAEDTAEPAADIAPKKTRLKVSTMLGSRS
jgi:hypothetical protein